MHARAVDRDDHRRDPARRHELTGQHRNPARGDAQGRDLVAVGVDRQGRRNRRIGWSIAPGMPGRYPARAGGPWLCRTLVLFLFHALVVPSGLTTRVQPHRWITIWWWNGHSSTQSVTEVVPPWALCVVWWTWQAPAGWVQPPAHWQCRSRSSTALRIPAGTVSAYPISKGRLGPPSRTPSSRRRKNEASPPGPDRRSTALPMTACSI